VNLFLFLWGRDSGLSTSCGTQESKRLVKHRGVYF